MHHARTTPTPASLSSLPLVACGVLVALWGCSGGETAERPRPRADADHTAPGDEDPVDQDPADVDPTDEDPTVGDVDPCDGGDCCTPRVTRVCDDQGNLVWLDGCGEEQDDDVQACPGGQCHDGACGCAEGFAGESCDTPVFFVRPEGSDEASGRRWQEAFATVGAALLAAEQQIADGATLAEVWVAEGTYTPPPEATARMATFRLVEHVHLYGGFSGTERKRTERTAESIAAHPTILSGEIGAPELDDNVFRVITAHVNNARLDGFIITRGQGPQGGGLDGTGAGLYAEGSSVVIANCVFTDNHATGVGGGIALYGGQLVVRDTTFFANTAFSGGAIVLEGGSADLSDVTFIRNRAFSGGAMYGYGGTTQLRNATFIENSAAWGGAISHDGPVAGSGAPLFISDTVFEGNIASQSGGAIDHRKAALAITRTAFLGNRAGEGGAINAYFVETRLLSVSHSFFFDNQATGDGGAIRATHTTLRLSHSILSDNEAGGDGGAIQVAEQATVHLGHLTLRHNAALGDGATLKVDLSGSAELENSIIVGGFDSALVSDGTIDVAYCMLDGGCVAGPGLSCGPGNLDAVPLFVDAFRGDLRLATGSPGVDAGNLTALDDDHFDLDEDDNVDEPVPVDLQGLPRVVGGSSDLGALENQAPCAATGSGTGKDCPAASCDAALTQAPMITLLGVWNPRPGWYWIEDLEEGASLTYCTP